MTDIQNWGRGKRGPQKYSYTYQDISRLTGLSISYLKKLNSKSEFNINDLESILDLILKHNFERYKWVMRAIEDGKNYKLQLLQDQDRKRRLKQLIKQTKHIQF